MTSERVAAMGRGGRRRPALVLGVVALVTVSAHDGWATSYVSPHVLAVGRTSVVAFRPETRHVCLFSLADGSLRASLRPAFAPIAASYDPREREFWGYGHDPVRDCHVLWTWREGGAEPVAAVVTEGTVAGILALAGGARIVLIADASVTDITRSPGTIFRLGRDGRLRGARSSPPFVAPDGPFIAGAAEGLLAPPFLIDGKTGIVVVPDPDALPRVLPGVFWSSAQTADGDWLITDEESGGTVWASADGARSWSPRAPIPAKGTGEVVVRRLVQDPYRRETVYAVVSVDVLQSPTQLWATSDGAGSWRPVLPGHGEQMGGWPQGREVLGPFFTPAGVWMEVDDFRETSRDDWTLRLERIDVAEPRRVLVLTAPALPPDS